MKIETNYVDSLNVGPDLLILTVGFEDRCLGILKFLNELDLKESTVILLCYIEQEYTEVNLSNKEKESQFLDFFNKKGVSVEKMSLDHINPLSTMNYLRSFFRRIDVDKVNDILIDISSLKDTILTLLLDFLLKNDFQTLKFIYTIPRIYNLVEIAEQIEMEDFSKNVLDNYYRRTSNLTKIEPFEGFEGFPDPTQPSRLILLAGFEVNKVLIVCGKYEDSWTTKKRLFIGKSSFIDNEKERELSRNIHSNLTQGCDLDFSFIECHDVQRIIETLEITIKTSIDQENIILCCFGTKLQVLACILLAIKYPKIILLKVQMKNYFPKYFSKGIEKSLMVKLTDL